MGRGAHSEGVPYRRPQKHAHTHQGVRAPVISFAYFCQNRNRTTFHFIYILVSSPFLHTWSSLGQERFLMVYITLRFSKYALQNSTNWQDGRGKEGKKKKERERGGKGRERWYQHLQYFTITHFFNSTALKLMCEWVCVCVLSGCTLWYSVCNSFERHFVASFL